MTIYVPVRQIVPAKVFEALEARGVEKALRKVVDPAYRKEVNPDSTDEKTYRAVFMNAVADTRIADVKEGNRESWDRGIITPSVRATGRSRGNNAVVVYAHIPNHFSDPDNIKAAVDQGLIDGAGVMPQKAFYDLLDKQDDRTVFVVDYDKLRKSPSGVMSTAKARRQPQTAPFLGGKERVDPYMATHEQVYGTNQIGNWHVDDLGNEPRARLLRAGYGRSNGLLGDDHLYGRGRFLAVEAPEAHSAPREISDIVQSGVPEVAVRQLLIEDAGFSDRRVAELLEKLATYTR